MPRGQKIPRLKAGPVHRSAVSNRERLFVDRDARGKWARRYADLVAIFADDLGGVDVLSEMKLALVRRAAAITLECERLEGNIAKDEEVDLDLLGRLTGHLRRLTETLGLDRVKKDITPTIASLVAEHAAAAQKPARPRKAQEPATIEAKAVKATQTPLELDLEAIRAEHDPEDDPDDEHMAAVRALIAEPEAEAASADATLEASA